MANETKEPVRRVNPKWVQAFLASESGRATLRREFAEGMQVKAGQHALLLSDAKRSDAIEYEEQVMAETLRGLGLHVTVMRVEALVPQFPGSVPVAFAYVSHHRIPEMVYGAIRSSDVIIDITTASRGAGKYNIDLYTLSTYYGKRVDGGRSIEGAEVLIPRDGSVVANMEAINFPCELLRAIGDRVNESLFAATEQDREFHLTNPWGTDLRFTALPGDVSQPAAGIRVYPDPALFRGEDAQRLYRGLAGVGVTQTCDGTWVTKYCPILGGELSRPMKLTLKDGFIAQAEGGPEATRLLEILKDENVGVHAILMGLNPKATPYRDGKYLHSNNGIGAGLVHIGIGGPGIFFRNGEWGSVGNKHFELGNVPRVSFWAGDECVCKDGQLLALADPAVREAARAHGNPDELLSQFECLDVPL